MDISNKGLELIKQFEGLRLKAYKCPAGVLTIGYGHTGGVRDTMTITKETADYLLKCDVAKFVSHVNHINKLGRYNFTQSQFDALVSFAFNVGSINQLTANGTRDIKTIAEKMLLYNKAGGRVLEGLTRRRKAEHDLFTEKFEKSETHLKSVDEIVKEVIEGKWGNGAVRKKKLTDAGYNYEEIRAKVNELKKGG